jgi:hypothetical protein
LYITFPHNAVTCDEQSRRDDVPAVFAVGELRRVVLTADTLAARSGAFERTRMEHADEHARTDPAAEAAAG